MFKNGIIVAASEGSYISVFMYSIYIYVHIFIYIYICSILWFLLGMKHALSVIIPALSLIQAEFLSIPYPEMISPIYMYLTWFIVQHTWSQSWEKTKWLSE